MELISEFLNFIIDSPWKISISLSVILIFVIYCGIYNYNESGSGAKSLPGPRGFPLVGFLPSLLSQNPHQVLHKFAKDYGEIFRIKIAGKNYIVLSSYDVMYETYVKDSTNFVNRPMDFSLLAQLFEFKAFAFVNGHEWKVQRQILSSCLKVGGKNKSIVEDAATGVAKRLVDKLQALNSEPTDIYNYLANSSIDFMSTLVSGKPLAATEPETAELLLNNMRAIFALAPGWRGFLSGWFMKIVYNPLTRTRKVVEKIQDRQFKLFGSMIQEHQENIDTSYPKDYIDAFLIERQSAPANTMRWFGLKNLTFNMLMICAGGTDTMSSIFYFCVYLMAKFPKIQDKCHKELDSIIGKSVIVCDDQKRLPYIEAVINEIIRYAAVASLPQPRMNSAPVTLRGFYIPAKTTFVTNLWTATQDPKYFSNPHHFDPDNFFEKNLPRGLTSLPFSAGNRICPGENAARLAIFMVFTAVLQKFVVSIPEERIPAESLLPGFLRALEPFKIIATPR